MNNKNMWKGFAIFGIWFGCAICQIFGAKVPDNLFYWALWATFWVTVA